jgi:hypothetical protein
MKEQDETELLPKRIDFEKGSFTANGTDYFIEGSLSAGRYCEFLVMEKEFSYGLTTQALHDKIEELIVLWKKDEFKAAVMLNDMQRGVLKVTERQPAALKICALFINAKGEDRAVFTNEMLDRKLNDWKAENIAMEDFFSVASNSVNGFLQIYAKLTRNISQMFQEANGKA